MYTKTILIVDDEKNLLILLTDFLEREGYKIMTANNGEEALELFKQRKEEIDFVILDVMMPKIDGWTVCREIRKISTTYILMLTARSEDYDEIHGFEIGANDYVHKPVKPSTLVARINAHFHLNEQIWQNNSQLNFEGLAIDKNSLVVSIDNQEINLSPKEYELLLLLVENKNKVISREKLLNDLWGYDYFGGTRTVDTHINRLRTKIIPYDKKIITVRGFGYRFEDIK